MANNNNNVRIDKFGNEVKICRAKDKSGNGFHKGFVEIKGDLFRLEFSDKTNKDDCSGWFTVTKLKKNTNRSNW